MKESRPVFTSTLISIPIQLLPEEFTKTYHPFGIYRCVIEGGFYTCKAYEYIKQWKLIIQTEIIWYDLIEQKELYNFSENVFPI